MIAMVCPVPSVPAGKLYRLATCGAVSGTAVGAAGAASGVTVSGVTVSGVTVSGVTVSGVTVSGVTVSGVTVSGVTVSGVTVSGVAVSGVTVSGVTVSGVTVSGVTVSGAAALASAGASSVADLPRSLSEAASSWPMPANIARSACAGASLTRSLTCGTRISHSPQGTGRHPVCRSIVLARCVLIKAVSSLLPQRGCGPGSAGCARLSVIANAGRASARRAESLAYDGRHV